MKRMLSGAMVTGALLATIAGASGAVAQPSSSQLVKDSEKKSPAAADASLARDEAKRAKVQASKAASAARDPKAKAAASAAAKSASAAASEADAARREAGTKGMAPK